MPKRGTVRFFCITMGKDGYLPVQQEYAACVSKKAAKQVMRDAIADFMSDGMGEVQTGWESYVDRGWKSPDASMWNFGLAIGHDGYVLSVIGMTEAEFNREMLGEE